MAEVSTHSKLEGLEIERDAVLATLEELRSAFERSELSRDAYEASRMEYSEKLSTIEAALEDLKRKRGTAAADYSQISWSRLRELARKRGLSVGKGASREALEAELRSLNEKGGAGALKEGRGESRRLEMRAAEARKEARAPPEAKGEEAMAKEAEEEAVPEVFRLELDPDIKARAEMLRAELFTLNSNLSTLLLRKRTNKSSLDVLKKNYADGLLDESTYKGLASKYEKDMELCEREIEEIRANISAIEEIDAKYRELSEFQSHFKETMTRALGELSSKERDLKFIESARLYLLSHAREYLKGIMGELGTLEDQTRATGISYPDADFLKRLSDALDGEKENLAKYEAKLDNFEGLLDSLERDKGVGEIDEETYETLRKEYTKEKNRTSEKIGSLKAKIALMEDEIKGFEGLKDSTRSCEAYLDLMVDSLKRIWLEDEIAARAEEIKAKQREVNTRRAEMTAKLDKLESELRVPLDRLLR